jgi:hypothetical protein
MPKGNKTTAAKPGAAKRVVYFTPDKVTSGAAHGKGAIRFVEATATGKPKAQSKSVWRNLYARLQDAEGGLIDYLDEDGDCTIKSLKVTIEIE